MAWTSRIRALFRAKQAALEIDEELRYHLAMREEANLSEGLRPDEARSNALRRFGNTTSLKEQMHEIDVFTFVESFFQDLRFAVRLLAKHPGFTAIAILALSVGIGVNTAVFTAYKAVLLQRLDARNPEQLVNVYRTTREDRYQSGFSYPDYEFYRDQNHVFSGLVATTGDGLALTGAEGLGGSQSSFGSNLAGAFGFRFPSLIRGGAEFVSSVSVSENYFAVLGVNAFRGRVFLPQDVHDLDAHPAVLLSENYWKRRFDGAISVLGKSIKLNGSPFTIIGITPHDFMGTNINVPDVWLPMRLRPLLHGVADILHNREGDCCELYARLAPGTSLIAAQSEMSLLADRVRGLHAPTSESRKPFRISLTSGSHTRPFSIQHDPALALAIALVMGAVGLVLLIACANVASMQLARSAARQREMGIRLSVGASRQRIIRQLLTESVLLGLVAGAVSILMAWSAMRVLMTWVAAALPIEWGSVAVHVEPDIHVFVYVFLVSLFAGVLFGLAPALETSRPSLSSALKEEGAPFASRLRGAGLRDLLVGTQVAVCLVLLVGAGLLIRGSIRSMTVSPGYEMKNVTGLDVNFPPGFNYTHMKQLAEIRQLRDRIHDLPGVTSVASGNPPDGGGLRTAAVGVNGARPAVDKFARTLFYSYVTPNYFQTLSIPLMRGRTFLERQNAQTDEAVLSESAAEALWPGMNPIGQVLVLDASHQFHGSGDLIPQGSYHVVGVAANTRGIVPGEADSEKIYLSFPLERLDDFPLLVRSNGDPRRLGPELSKQVRAVDADIVVYSATLEDLLTGTPTFVFSRLAAIFASIVGILGLALACVGIYGAVSYAVVRRTREVGIRMALGAQRRDVLGLVLLESGRPVLFGLLVGLMIAAGAGYGLRALLFGMSTLDPVSFGGVGGLFLLTALLAAYVPARRATLVDPMAALRCE